MATGRLNVGPGSDVPGTPVGGGSNEPDSARPAQTGAPAATLGVGPPTPEAPDTMHLWSRG